MVQWIAILLCLVSTSLGQENYSLPQLYKPSGVGATWGSAIANYDNQTLFVGASGDNQVFVYKLNDPTTGWELIQTINRTEAGTGQALAVDGTKLLIGATDWVFYYSLNEEGVWIEKQNLSAASQGAGFGWGSSIALQGDRAYFGVPNKGFGGKNNNGVLVPLIYNSISDAWTSQTAFTRLPNMTQLADGSHLGTFLAFKGSVLLAGAPDASINGITGLGTAVAYAYNGTIANYETQIQLPSEEATIENTGFGNLFALHENGSLIASKTLPYCYWFSRSENGVWTYQSKIITSSIVSSIAIEGDSALIGVSGNNTVYFLRFSPDNNTWDVVRSLNTTQTSTQYGKALAFLKSSENVTGTDVVVFGADSLEFGYVDCYSQFSGPSCVPCTCQNGICEDGIYGSGRCSSCDNNYFGFDCDANCTCLGGVCNQDISGDGHCVGGSCEDDYYGIDCFKCEPCVEASCNDTYIGNGECVCDNSTWILNNRTCTAPVNPPSVTTDSSATSGSVTGNQGTTGSTSVSTSTSTSSSTSSTSTSTSTSKSTSTSTVTGGVTSSSSSMATTGNNLSNNSKTNKFTLELFIAILLLIITV